MAQHFLLSPAARTLSLKAVMALSDDEARATFTAIRWSNNDGKPYCPKCGCVSLYTYTTRKIWKCKGIIGPRVLSAPSMVWATVWRGR